MRKKFMNQPLTGKKEAIQDEIASDNPQTTGELKNLTLTEIPNLEKSFENPKPEGGEKGVEDDRLNKIGDQIEELKTIFVNQMASLQETTALTSKKMLRVKDLCLLTGFKASQICRLTCYNRIPRYSMNGKTLFLTGTRSING